MIGYVTLENAKKFLENRYDISNIDDVNLTRGLHLALDKIESLVIRNNGKSETQLFIFPRTTECKVPDDVIKAQILEAYSIANGEDKFLKDINKGIASKSISDMSISYNKDNLLGNTYYANTESAKILKRYEQRTFGWSDAN